MLMAIDVGNTNINIGLFKDNRLFHEYSLPTKNKLRYVYINKLIRRFKIKDTILCSVVPSVTRYLEGNLRKALKGKLFIVGKNIKAPVKNLYRQPKQVGQDRLVNAYAGIMLYGAPLIVVDFGTAVTFDIISKNKEYLGGMILPGMELSLEALYLHTALLPRIKLNKPKEFIGRDTKNSMLSGIVYGLAALTDDLTLRIKDKIGKNSTIIGTGGSIGLIKNYCKTIKYTDKNLTLKGLNAIYSQRRN